MATSFRDEIRRGSITANLFRKNGGTADEILLGSGQTISYVDDVRGHNPAVIQIGSSAANNVIDNLPFGNISIGRNPRHYCCPSLWWWNAGFLSHCQRISRPGF